MSVIASTLVRLLEEGDQFVLRRSRRGRPAFGEEGQTIFTVKRVTENEDGTVKVFVKERHRALTLDPEIRVRLV